MLVSSQRLENMNTVYTTPKGIQVAEQFLDELFSQVIEPLKKQEGIPEKVSVVLEIKCKMDIQREECLKMVDQLESAGQIHWEL